ncbi:MAG: hypothetical protein ACK5Y2_09950 [Bdellovibrionales bacterium]
MDDFKSLKVRTETVPTFQQKVLIVEGTQRPSATLLIFPGYDGDLALEKNEPTKLTYNFFCRNRFHLATLGYRVVLVDSPQAIKGLDLQMSSQHRASTSFVEEYRELKRHLQIEEHSLWLCGMSRSVEGVIRILGQDDSSVRGSILLGCLTSDSFGTTSVLNLRAASLRFPTLIAHHKWDQCPLARPELARKFFDQIPHVQKQFLLVESGLAQVGSDPCKGNALHGFWGADQEVIEHIDRFAKNYC